ncbi:DNA cytosine methyltransferase [Aerococcus urinaeequi]|uniref:DNA cytosine methyltransferase n=1 Tax=Aerococcus urinaeequi TaxID=51665 RepID=UPI003D6AA095
MGFNYDGLWEIAYRKRLNKTTLRDKAGISNSTLARLSRNQTVSMDALAKLCDCLECGLDEIVEYKREDGEKMNYVSLFSSAGVGCYGFKQAGFECAATSELIERRLEVQRVNNKTKYQNGYILGDITKKEVKQELYEAISYYKENEKKNEIDVVAFTAPCQGMSVANHKKNDGTIEKNSLVVEALEIVKKIQPKFFVSENVRAFMNTKCVDHDNEKTIKDAFEDWLSEYYDYESKIINFKSYGANSSRTRSLVIGVRKDLADRISPSMLFPEKQTEREKTLREIIGHLPSLNKMGEIDNTDIYHNFKSYRPDMRNWIKDLAEGESAFDNEDPLKRPHRKTKDGEIIMNVQKNGDKYKRQYWDSVAPCVHTRNDILASQNTVHPVDDRVFSIRELMLMMNIPEDFKWSNDDLVELNRLDENQKEKYLKKHEINIRQSIGEAVPTIIMNQIAIKIKESIQ